MRIGSFQKALAKILPQLETEIVKRSDRTKGFVALPRRWVVERTFAWLGGMAGAANYDEDAPATGAGTDH